MALSISPICELPFSAPDFAFSAIVFAFWAFSTFIMVFTDISSIAAVSCSIELACSDAPCESTVLESEICPAPDASCSDAMLISESISLLDSIISASAIPSKSCSDLGVISTLRSPFAIKSATLACSLIPSTIFRKESASILISSSLSYSISTSTSPVEILSAASMSIFIGSFILLTIIRLINTENAVPAAANRMDTIMVYQKYSACSLPLIFRICRV